ncbi:hypothetical protein C8R46DRAFT_1214114 [Mycena filopes]|nr:hypothetical protein C8R46DRAFT_1214114 [Mycena filopes]
MVNELCRLTLSPLFRHYQWRSDPFLEDSWRESPESIPQQFMQGMMCLDTQTYPGDHFADANAFKALLRVPFDSEQPVQASGFNSNPAYACWIALLRFQALDMLMSLRLGVSESASPKVLPPPESSVKSICSALAKWPQHLKIFVNAYSARRGSTGVPVPDTSGEAIVDFLAMPSGSKQTIKTYKNLLALGAALSWILKSSASIDVCGNQRKLAETSPWLHPATKGLDQLTLHKLLTPLACILSSSPLLAFCNFDLQRCGGTISTQFRTRAFLGRHRSPKLAYIECAIFNVIRALALGNTLKAALSQYLEPALANIPPEEPADTNVFLIVSPTTPSHFTNEAASVSNKIDDSIAALRPALPAPVVPCSDQRVSLDVAIPMPRCQDGVECEPLRPMVEQDPEVDVNTLEWATPGDPALTSLNRQPACLDTSDTALACVEGGMLRDLQKSMDNLDAVCIKGGRRFRHHVNGNVPLTAGDHEFDLYVIQEEQWKGMSKCQRMDIWATGSDLFIMGLGVRGPQFNAEEFLSTFHPLDKPMEVQGTSKFFAGLRNPPSSDEDTSDHTDCIRATTLRNFLRHAKHKDGLVLNALVLPETHGILANPLVDSGFDLEDVAYRQTNTLPDFPAEHVPLEQQFWQIAGTPHTLSISHIDKAATRITVDGPGEKLWVRRRRTRNIQSSLSFHEWDPDKPDFGGSYEGVILPPNTGTLLMQAGTEHIVVGVAPEINDTTGGLLATLVTGGHFTAATTMRQSLGTLLHLVMMEHILTNVEHDGLWQIYTRISAFWIDSTMTAIGDQNFFRPYLPRLSDSTTEGWMDIICLASVIVLATPFDRRRFLKGGVPTSELAQRKCACRMYKEWRLWFAQSFVGIINGKQIDWETDVFSAVIVHLALTLTLYHRREQDPPVEVDTNEEIMLLRTPLWPPTGARLVKPKSLNPGHLCEADDELEQDVDASKYGGGQPRLRNSYAELAKIVIQAAL